MPVEVGLIFMIAIYCSSHMGAGIPAILVNIPGTAGAAATPLDGYPMAKKGMGQQALAISFIASCLGGLLTTVIALFAMPLLAQVGFYMHSVELIVVMLFGISLIATIASGDPWKGLIAGFFGLMIGFIGSDPVYETPRATFGFLELYDGVPIIPALVGLFAVSEAFLIMEQSSIVSEEDQANITPRQLGGDLRRHEHGADALVAHRVDQHHRPHRRRHPGRRRQHRLLRRLSAEPRLLEDARALHHRPSRRADRAGIRQQRRHLRARWFRC